MRRVLRVKVSRGENTLSYGLFPMIFFSLPLDLHRQMVTTAMLIMFSAMEKTLVALGASAGLEGDSESADALWTARWEITENISGVA
jgi:hypothetical protein